MEEQYKELTRGYQTALDSYNELQKKLQTIRPWPPTSSASNKENSSECSIPLELRPTNRRFRTVPYLRGGGFARGASRLELVWRLLIEMQNTSMRTERDVEFALRLSNT